jgi:DNA repair protein RadD
VAPTGAGKSLIIADIARQLDGKVMVLQPSKELLEQNYTKLSSYDIEASIYSASLKSKEVGQITFATIGSVANHMDLFDEFAAVIIDEAHGTNAAGGQYKDFIEKVPRKVLGLTATPYRLYTSQGIEVGGEYKPNGSYKDEDYFTEEGMPKAGVQLANKCILKFLTRTKPRIFNKVLYNIGIDTLLKQGYLANVRYFSLPVVDPSRVRRNSTGRDYDERSLSEEFARCSLTDKLADIVRRLLNPKDGKPRRGILVFTRFIAESEALCRAVPGSAVLTGETPTDERAEIIKRFKTGEIKVLANVGVLTTGFDYPELDTIVMASPTMSLARYYQIVGRVIRPFEGKDAWVIDMGGNVDRFGKVENLRLYEPKPGMYAIWGWVKENWVQLTNTYF